MRKLFISLFLILTTTVFYSAAKNDKAARIKLYPVKVLDKWGFINKSGKVIVTPKYDDIDKTYGFSEGMIGVKTDKKWGFVNDKGELVIQPQFDGVHGFKDGIAAFDKKTEGSLFGGMRGYVNKAGKIIVDPVYESPFMAESDFSDGLCLVKKNEKYGYIDINGKEVIALQYSWGTSFEDGVASVQRVEGSDTISCIIDKKGRIIADGFKSISNFSNGLASATRNGVQGIVKKDGTFMPVHDYSITFMLYLSCENGVLTVTKNDKYGLMNTMGELLNDVRYNAINGFSEGFTAANDGGKQSGSGWFKSFEGGWGFLDEKGQVAVAMQFDNVTYFSDGLAAAKKDGKWGYIDNKGNWIIQPSFADTPGPFQNGIAKIEIKEGEHWDSPSKLGYIDKTGKYIWTPRM
jgi:hypothetical protein